MLKDWTLVENLYLFHLLALNRRELISTTTTLFYLESYWSNWLSHVWCTSEEIFMLLVPRDRLSVDFISVG